MSKKNSKALVILFVFIFWGTPSSYSSDPVLLQNLLPDMEGWRQGEELQFYNKENLYEYINGNCELYFSYGFRDLCSAFYRNSADSSREIAVDIYDMGTVLNAFGVYSSMIHPDYDYEPIGNEAIISSQEIRFWQNRYEIEIRSNFNDLSIETLTNFARTISKKIPAPEPLAEFEWLVKDHQIPHTFKYVAKGFLGQDSLPGGFEAMYDLDGRAVKGFVSKCEDSEQSGKNLGHFLEAQNDLKGVELETVQDGFQSYHPYTGYMLVQQYNQWLFGAVSESNAGECRTLAQKIRKHLVSVTR